MAVSPVIGMVLGFSVVVVGFFLSGSEVGHILQPISALIVIGGTLGAVLVSFPAAQIRRAISSVSEIFVFSPLRLGELVKEIFEVATAARKDGLLAVEGKRAEIRDPFLNQVVGYIIDGFDGKSIEDIIHLEMKTDAQEVESVAEVWEKAGNFAPVIGVVGSIVGLIQVMLVLDQPDKIGQGIALAFTSALYGLLLANFVFTPWSNQLRTRMKEIALPKELVKIGALGIQEGIGPQLILEKLEALAGQSFREEE